MHDQASVEQALQVLPSQLQEIVFEIRRRAPEAHIIFVDYTTVLPDSGTCSRLTLTDAEADRGRELANRLREITAQAARETGTELLAASDITHGHDLCSVHPWVNGFNFPSHLWAFGPAPFHPTEEAMDAIAEATGKHLAPFLTPNKASKDMDWGEGAFVERRGTQLMLAGKLYRFGGMNIEWLGLEDYGPRGEVAPHIPF